MIDPNFLWQDRGKKGQAGKHGFGFEHPEGNPKHAPQDYILTTAKAGA
jgi:hypothetical protein